jgi:hypothetical protein
MMRLAGGAGFNGLWVPRAPTRSGRAGFDFSGQNDGWHRLSGGTAGWRVPGPSCFFEGSEGLVFSALVLNSVDRVDADQSFGRGT